MTDEQPQPGTQAFFLARFGSVAEHSPWVAEEVWMRYPRESRDEDFLTLAELFGRIIRSAPHERRLELLRAHPNLACGVAARSELTAMSQDEQQNAGLDKCSPEQFIEFQTLNLEYRSKFGFPFIIAVKDLNRHEILDRFRDRIERTAEQEYSTAIENVIRIISFRIEEIVKGHG